MLIIAGLIEGFFSPSHSPVALKFFFAAVLFLTLLAYLFKISKPDASAIKANSAP